MSDYVDYFNTYGIGQLFECLLCHHTFFVEGYEPQINIYCPKCDIDKKRRNFCIVIDDNMTKKKLSVLMMSEEGLTKTVYF